MPESSVDRIVDDLAEKDLSREERIRLLRELVREGRGLPDPVLEEALGRLLERLAEG